MSEKKVGAGVGVMIFKDGEILLGRRHPDREKADSALEGQGTWTMPGGKLEFGESFEECAKRETLEECGIQLNEISVMCVNNDIDGGHFVTIGIFCEDFSGEAQVLEPDKIVEWDWFGLDDLPNPVFMPSMKAINNYKQGKFYIEDNVV